MKKLSLAVACVAVLSSMSAANAQTETAVLVAGPATGLTIAAVVAVTVAAAAAANDSTDSTNGTNGTN